MNDNPISLVGPVDVRSALGAWVRTLRQRQGMTQGMLARKAGVPVSTLSLFERAGSGGVETLLRLLMALGELDAFDAAVRELMKKTEAPQSWDELETRGGGPKVRQRVRISNKERR